MEVMRHVIFRHRYTILIGAPIVVMLATSLGFTTQFDTLTLEPSQRFIAVGATTSIAVSITTTEPVNVIGGEITLSEELRVISIDTTETIVDLWSDEPAARAPRVITFSGGIIPTEAGGFEGSGTLFQFTVAAAKAGSGRIEFTQAEVLAHDGRGTNVLDRRVPLRLVVHPSSRPSPDLDADDRVSLLDVGMISRRIFTSYDPRYDLNTDGRISFSDVLLVMRYLAK